MKLRHSTCDPHKDGERIFGPVRHFGWTWLFQIKHHHTSVSKQMFQESSIFLSWSKSTKHVTWQEIWRHFY